MAHARFVYEEHEDMGTMGWRLMRHPTFEPTTPSGVAHDLVEHCPGDRGTVLEEVAAMGAFVYVEVESGYYSERNASSYPIPKVIASSFEDVVRGSRWTLGHLPTVPVRNALSLPVSDRHVDEIFLGVFRALEKSWDNEFDEPEFTFERIVRPRWPLLLQALRKGYRYAQQRYDSPDQAAELLRNIEMVAARAAALVEAGFEMVIHYETRGTLAHATLARNGYIFDSVGSRWH